MRVGYTDRPLVKQDAPSMSTQFGLTGCRARVLIAMPEVDTQSILTPEAIISILDRGRKTDEVIVNDQYECGRQEHKLINWTFEHLGYDRGGAQVGQMSDDGPRYWQWWDGTYDYIVREFETTGEYGRHFVLCDVDGNEIFDPYGGEYQREGILRELLYATWRT